MGNITSFTKSLFEKITDASIVFQLQGLRSVRHFSKFPPRTERIRGTIQVRRSFQIDGFVTDPSQLWCDTQPMNQMEQ